MTLSHLLADCLLISCPYDSWAFCSSSSRSTLITSISTAKQTPLIRQITLPFVGTCLPYLASPLPPDAGITRLNPPRHAVDPHRSPATCLPFYSVVAVEGGHPPEQTPPLRRVQVGRGAGVSFLPSSSFPVYLLQRCSVPTSSRLMGKVEWNKEIRDRGALEGRRRCGSID